MKEINGKEYIEKAPHDMEELLEIITILRSPQGCPWDRAQTHESMIKCLQDESEEVIKAIEKRDDDNLCEELGDVLLQVLLHAEIAKERGAFDFSDVVQMLSEKMIRRHPHVFDEIDPAETKEEGLARWNAIKQREKEERAKPST